MKTSLTLGLIFASLVIVEETNARPNRIETSITTKEHVGMQYGAEILGGPVWGIVADKEEALSDDEDDEVTRPISLKPSKQAIPAVVAPPVEHGSIQSGISRTTQNPQTVQESKPKLFSPTKCQAAVLSCCRFDETEKKKCFEQYNCLKTYATGKACLPEVINMVIKIFISYYRPR